MLRSLCYYARESHHDGLGSAFLTLTTEVRSLSASKSSQSQGPNPLARSRRIWLRTPIIMCPTAISSHHLQGDGSAFSRTGWMCPPRGVLVGRWARPPPGGGDPESQARSYSQMADHPYLRRALPLCPSGPSGPSSGPDPSSRLTP